MPFLPDRPARRTRASNFRAFGESGAAAQRRQSLRNVISQFETILPKALI